MHSIAITAAAMRHIIERHGGNRSSIARAEHLSLNTVRRLIREASLGEYADGLAAAGRRSGPRVHLSEECIATERDALLAALARYGGRDAAGALGWSTATLYRRMKAYSITESEIEDYKINIQSTTGSVEGQVSETPRPTSTPRP